MFIFILVKQLQKDPVIHGVRFIPFSFALLFKNKRLKERRMRRRPFTIRHKH